MSIVGCSPLKKLTVLAQMEPKHEFYFKNTILKSFEKKTSIKVNFIEYRDADNLESYLKKYSGEINLVQVPFEKSGELMRKGYFKPLDSFLSSDELRFFNDNYLLSSFGMVDGRPTLIPRQFETRLLVYSKSKVVDALKKWPEMKDFITSEIKKYTGFGLPSRYLLESDPNKWDSYDIAVIGLIWSNSYYNGKKIPRVAYRGGKNSELSKFIEDCICQMNGDSLNILGCKGDPVVDVFYREAVYSAAGIYNEMILESDSNETELMDCFAKGDIFLTFLSQSDCFYLHGTGHENNKGLLKDPSDLGVAFIPSAYSFGLDQDGEPLHEGTRSITTNSWWWAIPYNSSNTILSYKLAKFITDTVSQVNECKRYGIIPVRKEIVNEMSSLFKEQWIKDIFETAFAQILFNGTANAGISAHYDKIGNLYVELWNDIIGRHNWAENNGEVPDRNYIKKIIETKYVQRAAKIVSGSL